MNQEFLAESMIFLWTKVIGRHVISTLSNQRTNKQTTISFTMNIRGPMIRENRQLVTDEPVEFEE